MPGSVILLLQSGTALQQCRDDTLSNQCAWLSGCHLTLSTECSREPASPNLRTPGSRQQHSRPPAQVLPTQLIPDEKEGKVLRVRFIQKEGVKFFDPVYLFDEGSTISWIPCGRKLTCSFPGIKCASGPE